MSFVLSSPSSPFLIFSGGMPRASYGDRHCISIIHSKTHEALDFTSRIIDFFVLREGENHRGRERFSQTHGFGSFTFFFFYIYFTFYLHYNRFTSSQWSKCVCVTGEPSALMVLVEEELVVVDLQTGVARHPDALPGAITLFSHHLLAPRLLHPAQTLGESASCGGTAEYTLLQEGMKPYAHTF